MPPPTKSFLTPGNLLLVSIMVVIYWMIFSPLHTLMTASTGSAFDEGCCATQTCGTSPVDIFIWKFVGATAMLLSSIWLSMVYAIYFSK
jgi:hypothetical protein